MKEGHGVGCRVGIGVVGDMRVNVWLRVNVRMILNLDFIFVFIIGFVLV